MTCIKTGCYVYFPNYNELHSCDVFRVGNCLIIMSWPDQVGRGQGGQGLPDLIVPSVGDEFWRTDRGVFVVKEEECIWNIRKP